MDTNSATRPETNFLKGNLEPLREFHFVSKERDEQLVGNFVKSGSIDDLGAFLHARQDEYSHSEAIKNGKLHHNTTAPDETWKDPDKADRMALDTFTQLTSAKLRITGNGTVKVDYKKLKGLVHDFNSTSSSKQKYKDLQAIQDLARGK
jgi:hypothetical protein